jgi:ferredoxin
MNFSLRTADRATNLEGLGAGSRCGDDCHCGRCAGTINGRSGLTARIETNSPAV